MAPPRPRQPSRPELPRLDEERLEAIREEFSAFVDSRPPPAHLRTALERIEERISDERGIVTQTGRHDIEELQRQLRRMTEKAAAEKLEAFEDRAKVAEKKLAELEASKEKHAEKRGDRTWELVVGLILVVASVLATHFAETGGGHREMPAEHAR